MHMNSLSSSIALAFAAVTFASTAAAAPYSASAQVSEYCGLGICWPTAGGFSLQLLGTPTTAVGTGTLALDWYGESDDNLGEWLDVSLEGVSLGRLANSVAADDRFGGIGSRGADAWDMNYSGNRDRLISVSAALTNAELLSILNDGVVNMSGVFGYDVDDYGVGEYVKITLSFDTAGGTVPEPGSLALVAASGLGLWAARRRRHPGR